MLVVVSLDLAGGQVALLRTWYFLDTQAVIGLPAESATVDAPHLAGHPDWIAQPLLLLCYLQTARH